MKSTFETKRKLKTVFTVSFLFIVTVIMFSISITISLGGIQKEIMLISGLFIILALYLSTKAIKPKVSLYPGHINYMKRMNTIEIPYRGIERISVGTDKEAKFPMRPSKSFIIDSKESTTTIPMTLFSSFAEKKDFTRKLFNNVNNISRTITIDETSKNMVKSKNNDKTSKEVETNQIKTSSVILVSIVVFLIINIQPTINIISSI